MTPRKPSKDSAPVKASPQYMQVLNLGILNQPPFHSMKPRPITTAAATCAPVDMRNRSSTRPFISLPPYDGRVARVGLEPTASRILSPGGLPIAYLAVCRHQDRPYGGCGLCRLGTLFGLSCFAFHV